MFHRPFRLRRALFAAPAALALLASGCAPLLDVPSDIRTSLQGHTAVYSWESRGKTVFTCAYDKQGYYWKFMKSEGRLYSDTGKVMGTINSDWSITGHDGSRLSTRILTSGDAKSSADLKDLLFETTDSFGKLFSKIRYVERRNAERGMPLTKCSASQYEHVLRVPFRARYIFWN